MLTLMANNYYYVIIITLENRNNNNSSIKTNNNHNNNNVNPDIKKVTTIITVVCNDFLQGLIISGSVIVISNFHCHGT